MPLPEEFLLELKARNDIESVVSSYVTLKRAGKNLKGLCPFHNEKTPSFTLYPENGSFYCFGCGTGGDVIRFVRLIENLDYIDAVKLLAERAGMQLPAEGADDGMLRVRNTVLAINRETARFFHQYMFTPGGKEGLDYFHSRGLADSTIRHFGLGYAPDSWQALTDHLKNKGFSESDLITANVASRGKNGGLYDRFRARYMFPVIDVRGMVVAFSGRKRPEAEGGKYVNTADTPVYKKSDHVFALNFAKNYCADRLILCEGQMDAIALHQAGFQNAVAPLGTSFTLSQARLLARYTNQVVITFDADAAGQKATDRALSILEQAGVDSRVIHIPDGKDPDEFIRAHGEEGPPRFRALLENAASDVEYRLFQIAGTLDLATNDGVVRYLEEAAKLLGSLPSAVERDLYAGRLSEKYGVSKDAILTRAADYAKKQRVQKNREEVRRAVQLPTHDELEPERMLHRRAANAEEGLLAVLYRNPDFIGTVGKILPEERFVVEFHRKFYSILCRRHREGKSLDLTALSTELTGEEIGRITQIQAKESLRANSLDECRTCMGIMAEEAEKCRLKEKTASVTDSDYIEEMKRLSLQKRKDVDQNGN